MRLYEEIVENFKEDVMQNRIADKISHVYEEYYQRRANPSEVKSWVNSLNFVKNVVENASLSKNKIIIEYELPYSEKRIDVVLFGKDDKNNENIVIIELKQWSNENVGNSEFDGNVKVDFGKFSKDVPHPSIQVEGYYWHLKDFMTIFDEDPKISLSACVYCHNYTKGENEILYLPNFKENLKNYPLFSKQDMIELGKYLKNKLATADGLEVFGKFTHSILRPSKRLLDHTGDMINKQQIFHLIDEQITAYKAIMTKANILSRSKEKSVMVIPGGPGTGKSVIALEVMGELLRKGINVIHATGSSAFTNTLRNILGTRASKQFKFFNGFMKNKENDIDVLICDEAHRIRKTSISRFTPASLRTGDPQIFELIKCAKLSIFFIDENQVVRPDEIGSSQLIIEAGNKLNAKVYELPELKTQFRCGGSSKYLEKIEKILKIKEEGEPIDNGKEEKMKFQFMSSPNDLKKAIDEKNKERKNSARIVAGFCWPWSSPNKDGTLVNDVKIGDFEMPWEKKDDFWRWATDDSGMGQVGTVYTSQGFEFDYIGVIFGNDLIWNGTKWEAISKNSYDSVAKRGNINFDKHLKNIYRVLLSRAHKGVYIYFIDKKTEEYFKKHFN